VPPAEALRVTITITTTTTTTTTSITIITTSTKTTTTATISTTAITTTSNYHTTTTTTTTTIITNLLSFPPRTQALCHEQRRCGFLTAEVQRIFRVSEQVLELNYSTSLLHIVSGCACQTLLFSSYSNSHNCVRLVKCAF
jgi:hypothetical protein